MEMGVLDYVFASDAATGGGALFARSVHLVQPLFRFGTVCLKTLAALGLGFVAAFCAFGILFSCATKDLFPAAFLPLVLAAAGSFVLGWIDEPRRWLWLAFCVALPTLVMSALIFIQLVAEDRTDWGWIAVMGTSAAVCAVSGWLGFYTRRIVVKE
jgi:hypothetical protein